MDKDKKNVLGKLKLNQLRKSELEKREMNALKGGCTTSSVSYTHLTLPTNQQV